MVAMAAEPTARKKRKRQDLMPTPYTQCGEVHEVGIARIPVVKQIDSYSSFSKQ